MKASRFEAVARLCRGWRRFGAGLPRGHAAAVEAWHAWQDLYPYAKRGPITYTPPEQRLFGRRGMTITAGWYQTSPEFFDYLVEKGLSDTNPVDANDGQSAPDTAPASRPMLWVGIALALAGLVAVPMAAPRLRRRVLAVASAHR